jgi:hypothetical protein
MSIDVYRIYRGLWYGYISPGKWACRHLCGQIYLIKLTFQEFCETYLKIEKSSNQSLFFSVDSEAVEHREHAGNPKEGTITVPLTSCLTGLESAV